MPQISHIFLRAFSLKNYFPLNSMTCNSKVDTKIAPSTLLNLCVEIAGSHRAGPNVSGQRRPNGQV